MTVCIASNIDDVHAICVASALISKGERVINWHWADFPGVDLFSVKFNRDKRVEMPILDCSLKDVSVWIHRGIRPIVPPGVHPADIDFVNAESYDMLSGIMNEIAGESFCVNPIHSVQKIRPKINQLSLAVRCGLKIPPSIFSNDPSAIRAFFDEQEGNVIVKHFSQLYWEAKKRDKTYVTATNKISVSDLKNDSQLALCPAIFQKHMTKSFELRVIFFGRSIFAVKIDSQKCKNSIDWRIDYNGLPPVSVFELPISELGRIQFFIEASGLRYGSLDFIVDECGEYFFLEVNETGQFLWVEELLPQLPLLDCFAEFLISRDPLFLYRPGANPVKCGDFDENITAEEIRTRSIGHVERKNSSALLE